MSIGGRLFLMKSRYVAGPTVHRIYRARFARSPSHQALFTSDHTELCLEGFPRSANSYAYNAFSVANSHIQHYARHIHSPSQISEAVRLERPTLLVIRPPRDAVSSFMGHYQARDIDYILKGYIAYYRHILPYAPKVVVSDFSLTTGDLSQAIQALNTRFSTTFNALSKAQNAEAIDRLKSFDNAGRGTSGLAAFTTGKADKAAPPEMPAQLLAQAQMAYDQVAEHRIT